MMRETRMLQLLLLLLLGCLTVHALDPNLVGSFSHSSGSFSYCVGWNPDGQSLIAGDTANHLLFYNFATGKVDYDMDVYTQVVALNGNCQTTLEGIYSCEIDPTGTFALVALGSCIVKIRLSDYTITDTLDVGSKVTRVNVIKISPDGTQVAWGMDAGTSDTSGVVDLTTFTQATNSPFNLQTSVYAAAWHPTDGTLWFSAESEVIRYVATTGLSLSTWNPSVGNNNIWGLEVTSDGSTVVVSDDDAVITWFDVATGSELRAVTMSGGAGYSIISITPDNRYVAAGDALGRLWLYQMSDGSQVGQWVYYSNSGWVEDVKFSPNGLYLAVAGDAGRTQIWDVFTYAGNDGLAYLGFLSLLIIPCVAAVGFYFKKVYGGTPRVLEPPPVQYYSPYEMPVAVPTVPTVPIPSPMTAFPPMQVPF